MLQEISRKPMHVLFQGFAVFLTQPINGQLRLKRSHHYFAQVQGQMAIGAQPWRDFVVHTRQDIHVEHLFYDEEFWNRTLLPKLTSFYDNCVAPEIVSPLHSLGLLIRDMAKQS